MPTAIIWGTLKVVIDVIIIFTTIYGSANVLVAGRTSIHEPLRDDKDRVGIAYFPAQAYQRVRVSLWRL
jgi:hypothetical protein